MWDNRCKISISAAITNKRNWAWCMGIVWIGGNLNKWKIWHEKMTRLEVFFIFKQNKRTVTSMSFTNFHTLCWLIRARNCSFVPIGTAWSTGNSFWFIMACCCFVWFFKCALIARFPLIRPIGGASLYKATSYSNRPGVSSTTPVWRKQ